MKCRSTSRNDVMFVTIAILGGLNLVANISVGIEGGIFILAIFSLFGRLLDTSFTNLVAQRPCEEAGKLIYEQFERKPSCQDAPAPILHPVLADSMRRAA